MTMNLKENTLVCKKNFHYLQPKNAYRLLIAESLKEENLSCRLWQLQIKKCIFNVVHFDVVTIVPKFRRDPDYNSALFVI